MGASKGGRCGTAVAMVAEGKGGEGSACVSWREGKEKGEGGEGGKGDVGARLGEGEMGRPCVRDEKRKGEKGEASAPDVWRGFNWRRWKGRGGEESRRGSGCQEIQRRGGGEDLRSHRKRKNTFDVLFGGEGVERKKGRKKQGSHRF